MIERAATEVFAERGYHGASIDEIARRSGVTPPVVYDHFSSKLDLHRRLLERTRDELVAMWREQLAGDEPAEERIPRALDAWARYVESNPYAARMYFQEPTGDPQARAIHAEVQAPARATLAAILAEEPGAENIAGRDEQALEMAAEVMRAGLTGLAIWWIEHPEVPRERIVETAVNAIWIGFERVRRGRALDGLAAERAGAGRVRLAVVGRAAPAQLGDGAQLVLVAGRDGDVERPAGLAPGVLGRAGGLPGRGGRAVQRHPAVRREPLGGEADREIGVGAVARELRARSELGGIADVGLRPRGRDLLTRLGVCSAGADQERADGDWYEGPTCHQGSCRYPTPPP